MVTSADFQSVRAAAQRLHGLAHRTPVMTCATLDRLASRLLPKSALAQAVNYALNQWAALCRYTDDGRLSIDNNVAERRLRDQAIGRKNWLFAGSFEGAKRAALLYSLVQSCTLIDVSPFEYLKDVLLRVATHPQRVIGQLTPRGWSTTFCRQQTA